MQLENRPAVVASIGRGRRGTCPLMQPWTRRHLSKSEWHWRPKQLRGRYRVLLVSDQIEGVVPPVRRPSKPA
jgi:hypothetical protein